MIPSALVRAATSLPAAQPERVVDAAGPGELRVGDRVMVNMASNDYLGFARDPRLVAAARAALEQGHAERSLQIGDHAGHCRLRHAQLGGGLRHAPALADGEKDMQVAQPDAATDLMLAIEFVSHASTVADGVGFSI